jgi:hypothetical protein
MANEALDDTPPLPAIEVDDEFKTNVKQLYEDLGLNSWGTQWFFRIVAKRPFSTLEKLTDSEWSRAYDTIMDVMNGKLVPSDHMFKQEKTPELPPVDPSEPKNEKPDA